MCSATKLRCSFSHVKLCTEIQLWCHFLYHLQCRWLSWAENLSHSRYNTCSTITCSDEACWSCVPGSTKDLASHLPWKPFCTIRKLMIRYFPVVTSSPIQSLFSSMQWFSCYEYSFLVFQCISLHFVMLTFCMDGPRRLDCSLWLSWSLCHLPLLSTLIVYLQPYGGCKF